MVVSQRLLQPCSFLTFDKLCEALAGAAVVQSQAGLTLLLHAETRRLDFGEGEAKVLVEVIQFIDEVAYISSQHLGELIISVIQNRMCNSAP